MIRRLVIAGAGEFGREVAAWVRTSPQFRKRNSIGEVAFIDDSDISMVNAEFPILGDIKSYQPAENDLMLCSVGNPRVKAAIVAGLKSKNALFASFVHDSVIIGGDVKIGEGVIVCPGVVISTDVEIGEHAHVNAVCTLGHDVRVGAFATMSSNCSLTGNVVLGRGVFLGTSVTVIPGKSIGENSTVGAGSVVLRSLPANVAAFGNPCRQIGKL